MQRESRLFTLRLGGAALLLVLAAVAGSPASAQVNAKVTGTVTDVDGNPMVKVPVILEIVQVEGRAPGVLGKVKTKKNGAFTYPFLTPGTYKIYPEIEGYLVLKVDAISVDSQKNIRFGKDDGSPEVLLINKDQSNLPAIPVAPQGQGALVSGKCIVNIVVVKAEDHDRALAALRQGDSPVTPGSAPATPVVSRKRDPVERGDEFYAGGDYVQAAAAYQEALDEDPERADAAYGLGKTLLKQDDLAGAQQAFMKTAKLDPAYPGAHFYLATIYHSLAQDDAAIAALVKERENTPDDETVLVNLGQLYRDTKQPEKAQEVLLHVVELNPENTDAYLVLADSYNQMGNNAKAEEIYKMILDRSPGQEDIIWYNIGVNAYNKDNRDAAAQAFENSLKANPKNSDAHKMLGYTLVGLGRNDEAIPHFESYLKLDPKGPDAETVKSMVAALKAG